MLQGAASRLSTHYNGLMSYDLCVIMDCAAFKRWTDYQHHGAKQKRRQFSIGWNRAGSQDVPIQHVTKISHRFWQTRKIKLMMTILGFQSPSRYIVKPAVIIISIPTTNRSGLATTFLDISSNPSMEKKTPTSKMAAIVRIIFCRPNSRH